MAYALFIDQGLQDLVDIIVLNSAHDLAVGLYTNNYAPQHGDGNGNYTECALAGYAEIPVNTLVWTPNTSPGEGSSLSATAEFTFDTYVGSVTIFGFFLVNQGNDTINAAALLDLAYPVPNAGGTLAFTLEIATFPNTGPFP